MSNDMIHDIRYACGCQRRTGMGSACACCGAAAGATCLHEGEITLASLPQSAPPGCVVDGPGVYKIKDRDAFLAAVGPILQRNLAQVQDLGPDSVGGEGWTAEVILPACPVQIEGTVDGLPYSFRARWARWWMGIAASPAGRPKKGPWALVAEGPADAGDEFGASWMPHSEALRHIEESIVRHRLLQVLLRRGQHVKTGRSDP